MTREEAQLELDATTLRPQDASAEARAMAESDPTLGAWLQKRTAFDEDVSEAFAASIPAGLRENILQSARSPAKNRVHLMMPALLSAAAAIIVGWVVLWPGSGDMPAWQADSLAAVAKVQYGMSRLDQRAGNLEAVKKLLAATSSPSPSRLPGSIGDLPTYGCKRIQIGHHPATIICFKMESGDEAHLVVLDSQDLDKIPPLMRPQFDTSKNWHMASWSDGSQTFLLATTADEAALKKLFGLA